MIGSARRLRDVVLHSWPQKLGAFVLALLVWWFVTVNDTPQTQASLVVPIEVEGVGSNSVVTGLPENVVVTIRGPSLLIDRLQRESVGAIIDLAGRSGEFEEPINVLIPRGVELVSVSPTDVIGTIEPLTSKQVPVEAVVIGVQSLDVRLGFTVDPAEVTVSGLASTLEQVVRVLAPVRSAPGDRSVSIFAANTDGQPVSGATVNPGVVNVSVAETTIYDERTVEVTLVPPAVPGFAVAARLDSPQLRIAGPPSIIAQIDRVTATVDFDVTEPASGSYTIPVELDLPEGVFARLIPTATIRLTQSAIQE